MCGIAGFYAYGNVLCSDPQKVIKRMTDVIAHRGPDDEGMFCDNEVYLGHRRLSIIDLTSAAHQPMVTRDLRYVIVYNGEVYNYRELRARLIRTGHVFYTESDTEVILNMYREYGEDTPSMLNGIFAFAIWDRTRKELFLARDHIGVKPLYYHIDQNRIVFSSEIKSLLEYPGMQREIDPLALNQILTYRFSPAPQTIFKGICKLEPATRMLVSSNKIEKKKYWERIPIVGSAYKEEYYINKLVEMYTLSVKRQIISDAPIGLSLSGGIDSGILLAIMTQMNGTVNSFTVEFEGGEKESEIKAAQFHAKLFNSEFHPSIVSAQDYVEFFDSYIWHLEEPVGNESAAAYYFVAREAAKHVKVLLNGQGIDETMAGYNRYIGAKYAHIYRLLPGLFRKHVVQPIVFKYCRKEVLRRAVFSLGQRNAADRMKSVYEILPEESKFEYYNKEYAELIKSNRNDCYERIRSQVTHLDDLSQMLYVDTRTSLPENMLLCEDKMSMAASIEARVPFLDIELLEFIETIPSEMKLRALCTKYIHKKVAEGFLPKSSIYVRKKGFDNPMDRWLRESMTSFFDDIVFERESITTQYLNVKKVRQLYDMHNQGKRDYTRMLYLLMSIEMWRRKFIECK